MSQSPERRNSEPACSFCKGCCLEYSGNMGNCEGKGKKEDECPPGKKPVE